MLNNSKIGKQLQTNKIYKIGEILLILIVAFTFLKLTSSFTEDSSVLKQAMIWSANLLMLVLVWLGLKIRGVDWYHFGLTFKN